jgi:hypothetical protein
MQAVWFIMTTQPLTDLPVLLFKAKHRMALASTPINLKTMILATSCFQTLDIIRQTEPGSWVMLI